MIRTGIERLPGRWPRLRGGCGFGALVCYGIGTSTGNVAFSTVIQSHVPDSLRGWVFTTFDLIWHSMRLASLLVGGLLANAVGIRAVYYLAGVLMIAAALAGWTSTSLQAQRHNGAEQSPCAL